MVKGRSSLTSHGKMQMKCGWREDDESGWRMEREKRDARWKSG
jgi:hypothetical protein